MIAVGARCGHIDGKARVGSYVVNEEIQAAFDAAAAQGYEDHQTTADFFRGYKLGYLLGVEGSPLPPEYL